MKFFYTDIKTLSLSIIFLSIHFFVSAQETNNWYFGFPGGMRIDFNSGSPVVTSGYPLTAGEGSSSISDAAGVPLLYSNGINIWDASNNTQINGTAMLGGTSSAQSAIIIPKPGTTNQYLVFTSTTDPGDGTDTGLNYYTVTGTPGAFTISGATNLSAAGTVGEGLALIRSTLAGTSFWIVSRERSAGGSIRFISFPVSTAGALGAAVFSSVAGAVNFTAHICNIKTNPCETKLAITYLNANTTEVYDFDKASGQVTARTNTFAAPSAYGLEFSPNSLYLYVSQLNQGILHQYTLSSSADFTYTQAATGWTGEMGEMQIGPDNRIYIADPGASSLGVIANPDNAPAVGNLAVAGLALPGANFRGLPTYPKYFQIGLTVSPANGTYCVNQNIALTSVFAGSLSTRNWTITPGTNGVNWTYITGTSTDASPTIRFLTGGTYTVTLTVTDNCSRTFTEVRTFVIEDYQTPSGAVSCGGTTMLLQNNNADPDAPNYIWYRNSISDDNIIGTGSPVTYILGAGATMPANICLGQSGTAPVVSSGSSAVSTSPTAAAFGFAPVPTPYSSPTFNVLSDNLVLKTFDIKTWTGCGSTVTVRIRQGATTWYTTNVTLAACGTAQTINLNTTLQQGNNYYIEITGTAEFYGGSIGGSTAHISYGTAVAGATTNLTYDYRNYTTTYTCTTPICYPVTCSLPVSLINFSGNVAGDDVKLDWSTASEIGNAFFEVQRSLDGVSFQTIGTVTGAGNSNNVLTYGLTDFVPATGINYYRLVQHDVNGEVNIGNTISILFNSEFDFVVIPNPSSSTFSIVSNLENSSLSISDITGRELFRTNNANEMKNFGSELPTGIYIVTVNSSAYTSTKKIVKE